MEISNPDKELMDQLISDGCFKVGEFKLKSGALSSYYIDLREVTHHLKLSDMIVKQLKDHLVQLAPSGAQVFVVGVPYGVWPLAAQAAREAKLPFHQVRKEVKDHGRKPDVSAFKDSRFILIEDVMSTGSSIIETIKKMDGMSISDVIVIVDREMDGKENLTREYPQIKLHSLLRASELSKVAQSKLN